MATAPLHLAEPGLRFCTVQNFARVVSEVYGDRNLRQWSHLEMKLDAFRHTMIPQKPSSSSSSSSCLCCYFKHTQCSIQHISLVFFSIIIIYLAAMKEVFIFAFLRRTFKINFTGIMVKFCLWCHYGNFLIFNFLVNPSCFGHCWTDSSLTKLEAQVNRKICEACNIVNNSVLSYWSEWIIEKIIQWYWGMSVGAFIAISCPLTVPVLIQDEERKFKFLFSHFSWCFKMFYEGL